VSRTAWKVLATIGGVLAIGGPVVGVMATVVGLGGAFYAIENTDPSMKAQRLAEGISLSMYATVAGIAIFPVGAILFGLSIWQLLRRPASSP